MSANVAFQEHRLKYGPQSKEWFFLFHYNMKYNLLFSPRRIYFQRNTQKIFILSKFTQVLGEQTKL